MPTKKPPSYIKTTTVETVTQKNSLKSALLQKDFENIENSNNIKNISTEELKEKLIL